MKIEDRCIWCNERPVVENSLGCCDCPTIPYICSCNAIDQPHDITCERNPNFAGIRKYDSSREMMYNGKKAEESCWPEVKNVIEKALEELCKKEMFPRYKILSCEQDPKDPAKITVTFEWVEV